ncbi:MAG: nitroreductase family protein [bacterium]
MELKETVLNRRSIREYDTKDISENILIEIMDAVRFYPSWKNSQTSRFYFIKNQELKEKLANEATINKEGKNAIMLRECNTLLVMTIKTGLSGTHSETIDQTTTLREWEMFDSGIASQTFSLVAFEKGIGSVILGIFKNEIVKELCNIPKDEVVSVLIPLGYIKDKEYKAPRRKELDELIKIIK